ncbi:MAG TPA: sugar phosphate isomerase/epimerase family protein [Terriglobales bacterium]|nr:sugar phosphate isomerase/epimerase family protein [Terriglobales bacterium]
MPIRISRREFVITGMGALALGRNSLGAAPPKPSASNSARLAKSPFKIAVITDEISQDFGHACEVASQQFGMGWVEIRSAWKKNIANFDAQEVAEILSLLKKHDLRVTDIASPLFKTDWPGAPKSKFAEKDQFNANFTYAQQDEVLDRCIELAKKLSTDRIRCFDFWRLDNPAPHRNAINEVLQKAAEKTGRAELILLLENEYACNTGTGAEAAKTLAGVPSRHFMLNWDPGNAAKRGEIPYPGAYNRLPKDRIGHCHVKDVERRNNDYEWAAMGKGLIDWSGQFAALKRDGYHHAVSLETHWRGAGTPEASSIECWQGMRAALAKADAI